mmetsp:Transcript_13960/g.15959  ORF Transcript_13960/g.15959 Transcript_13960/m.15959 type:complete len:481 (+) Transcript_13960:114-1556(+)
MNKLILFAKVLVTLLKVGPLFFTTVTFAFLSPSSFTYLENSKLSFISIPTIVHESESESFSSCSCSSWSKISEYDVNSESYFLMDTYSSPSSSFSKKYDLASPREWLEYCEKENGMNSGAYTVIRCDLHLDKKCWRIWGKEFHLKRLRESFRCLLLHQRVLTQQHQGISDGKLDEKLPVRSALDSTTKIMNLLLDEAEKTIDRNKIILEEKEKGAEIVVIMLTLLWESNHIHSSKIRARGHAFSTLKVSHVHDVGTTNNTNPNQPIQAVIGFLSSTTSNHIISQNYNSSVVSLPNRYQNFPQAKLSCWCRRRRLLEEIFKKDDVGDVILTKCSNGNKSQLSSSISTESIELLEGLTSNIFFVYPGGLIRTPPSSDTLPGYARQLILDCAVKCGYQVEVRSIPLKESSSWKEVFLTSSIRLIVPVRAILLPSSSVDGNIPIQLETFWEMIPDDKTNIHNNNVPVHDTLYKQVMKQNNDNHI